MKEVKQEVNKQIAQHPVINKLAKFMIELEEQKAYGVCCSEQKSTQSMVMVYIHFSFID